MISRAGNNTKRKKKKIIQEKGKRTIYSQREVSAFKRRIGEALTHFIKCQWFILNCIFTASLFWLYFVKILQYPFSIDLTYGSKKKRKGNTSTSLTSLTHSFCPGILGIIFTPLFYWQESYLTHKLPLQDFLIFSFWHKMYIDENSQDPLVTSPPTLLWSVLMDFPHLY